MNDVNKPINNKGETKLHEAVREYHFNDIPILIKQGADVNARDNEGNTPLHLAVKSEYLLCVDLLINGGANVNATNKKGNTPMHLLGWGDENYAKSLIKGGADLHAVNNEKKTAHNILKHSFTVALLKGVLKIEEAIEKGKLNDLESVLKGLHFDRYKIDYIRVRGIPLLHALIEQGGESRINMAVHLISRQRVLYDQNVEADENLVNLRDSEGKAPFHYAAKHGDIKFAYLLKRYGADVNLLDNSDEYPLNVALRHRNVDVAERLIVGGAYLNHPDQEGNPPLIAALSNEQVDIAKLLIERGADVTMTDENGMTPLQHARAMGLHEDEENDQESTFLLNKSAKKSGKSEKEQILECLENFSNKTEYFKKTR